MVCCGRVSSMGPLVREFLSDRYSLAKPLVRDRESVFVSCRLGIKLAYKHIFYWGIFICYDVNLHDWLCIDSLFISDTYTPVQQMLTFMWIMFSMIYWCKIDFIEFKLCWTCTIMTIYDYDLWNIILDEYVSWFV